MLGACPDAVLEAKLERGPVVLINLEGIDMYLVIESYRFDAH